MGPRAGGAARVLGSDSAHQGETPKLLLLSPPHCRLSLILTSLNSMWHKNISRLRKHFFNPPWQESGCWLVTTRPHSSHIHAYC